MVFTTLRARSSHKEGGRWAGDMWCGDKMQSTSNFLRPPKPCIWGIGVGAYGGEGGWMLEYSLVLRASCTLICKYDLPTWESSNILLVFWCWMFCYRCKVFYDFLNFFGLHFAKEPPYLMLEHRTRHIPKHVFFMRSLFLTAPAYCVVFFSRFRQ